MDTTFVRSRFPGLECDWILMDNAGGSQIASPVMDRMMEFYRTSNVQLGASYDVSSQATARVALSQKIMAGYINAGDPGEVIMGSST
ncbi:MAG: aminotransferase class V-fold PLP-dependent enzyme, partial [Bacteroidales bacterium]